MWAPFPRGPQILGQISEAVLQGILGGGPSLKGESQGSRDCSCVTKAPPIITDATTNVVHMAHYSTQKGAIHISIYMNDAFLSRALHTAWLKVATLTGSKALNNLHRRLLLGPSFPRVSKAL